MTPAEHYDRAEQHLAAATERTYNELVLTLLNAQVHATLAQTPRETWHETKAAPKRPDPVQAYWDRPAEEKQQ